jgi:glycosyltransferase involved in cell wall biosynthesis
MNIVMITENDPAGMGIAFTNAINRYTTHCCRLITTQTRYNFDFEKDIHVPDLDQDGFDEVVHLLKHADIVHFHILADENIPLGPIRLKDYVDGKTMIHHHHGHPDFRANPQKYGDKYRRLRRKALVSTPDLLKLLPEAEWQPNLVPVHSLLYRPLANESNGKVRICQSPTRKDLKNTDEFKKVLVIVKRQFERVEDVIIENTNHQQCLRIKQNCDIHFDHMQGYFGVSSLEGLSQGKPVIAGLDDWNIGWIREFTGEERIPWIIARDSSSLEQVLTDLVHEEDKRREAGLHGRVVMEKKWSEEKVINRLIHFYQGL